ncbi:MAG: PEP-CTERM sorting domain-containing protein [Rubrivivax sp.]|nr:MAG: PEP-CTERM sorting domain-containing protein [Rubrivivax sp.]
MKSNTLVFTVAAFACGSVMAQNYPYEFVSLAPLKAKLTLSSDALTVISASSSVIRAKSFNPADDARNQFQLDYPKGEGTFALTSTNTQGDRLVSATSAPSSLLFRRTTVLGDNVEDGLLRKSLFLSNFSFDLNTGTIASDWKLQTDIEKPSETNTTVTDLGRLALFQATLPVQGGKIVPSSDWNYPYYIYGTTSARFSDLQMPADSANVFLTSLGLSTAADDPLASLARTATWGSLVIAVPEPSTYTLMGIGLLLVGSAIARQRANHQV